MLLPTDTLFIMQAPDKDGTYPDAFFPQWANIMYRLASTGIDFAEHMFENGGRTEDERVSIQLSRPARSRPENAHRLYHRNDVRAASQEATRPYLTTDGALGFMFRCRPENIPTMFLDKSIESLDLGARTVSAKLLEVLEPGHFVLHTSGSVVSVKVNDKTYRNISVDSKGKPRRQRQRQRQKQSMPYRDSFYIRPSRDTAVFLAFDERYKTASGVYWSTPSSANIVRAVWSDNQQDMPRPPDLAPNEFRVCIKVSESKADGHFLWSGGVGQNLPHTCLSTTGAMFIAFNCCAGDARYIAGKVQNMLM